MKTLIIAFLLSIPFCLFAQDKIAGNYRDHFSSRIQLNSDSTFKFTFRFDLLGSWTKGTWRLQDDTVYFDMVLAYDTISYRKSNNLTNDSLILSIDEIPERLTPEQYTAMGLYSSGQNLIPHPNKLVCKNGRLYRVKNGKLVVKKEKSFGIGKKWAPWFFKIDD
jgi:hypothetical protein